MNYLQHLNEQQRIAVENTEGPYMVIAGAGSGKTRVLTYRIAHLIHEQNVDPFSIMALTFTNKAAKEMRHRIEDITGMNARNIWLGTFHSVFARILRTEAEHIGYPNNFSIYDVDDSLTLIKAIIKEMGLDDERYKANIVYNRISSAKNRLISWQEYANHPLLTGEDTSSMRPEIGVIYRNYALRCFKSGGMDFDDLLFNTDYLFKERLDILNKYQHRIKYLLVDEFQDTNLCQYFIIRKLAAVHQNICVVGDDAQSIYAFRGADISNVLNFEKDYPDLRTVKLEQNYRSTKMIVRAANSVISKNAIQLPKNIWTDNEEGSSIELFKAASDNEEAKLIAHSIFEEKMQNQLKLSDFVVLYRTNSQSRALEEALRKINIKYKIVGGLSFYKRKEIKDMIAYLRFAVNQRDEASFRRIINLPKRGIGNVTVSKIIVAAEEHTMSLWEVLKNAKTLIGGRIATVIEEFVTLIKRSALVVKKKDAYEASLEIMKCSGMMKSLHEDKTVEGIGRYDNMQEMLNAIKKFVDHEEKEDKSLESFIEEITLFTDASEDETGHANSVTLMTIHMAKGLEFGWVYIAGLEENLFPSQRMLSAQHELEEERRLFYVALTRAKQKLFLSYALTRYRFGHLNNCEPSRFLHEIDAECIKKNNRFMSSQPPASSNCYTRQFVNSMKRSSQNNFPKIKKHESSPSFVPNDTSNLQQGMKIEHLSFGTGTVVSVDNAGHGQKALINFLNFGEKTIILSFAKIKIL